MKEHTKLYNDHTSKQTINMQHYVSHVMRSPAFDVFDHAKRKTQSCALTQNLNRDPEAIVEVIAISQKVATQQPKLN